MAHFEDVNIDGLAPFANSAAMNTYYTYTPSAKMAFWTLFAPRYSYFGTRYLQHWLYWYDGWVPYFHKTDNGIFSTHLAQSLVNRIANKIYGGRLMFKNAGKEHEPSEAENKTLQTVAQWAIDCDFDTTVGKAITFSAAAGTSLLKLNKSNKQYWAEALRFDSFIPTVDFAGNVVRVTCYLQQYADLERNTDGKQTNNYFLVEERYFGDYETKDGVWKNQPLVKYSVKRATGVVGSSADINSYLAGESIEFRRLPRTVRNSIRQNYSQIRIDEPTLLPFNDWLGVELVQFTRGISDLPQLPFGESLLAPIISQLMTYDYYYSAFATDMYNGRGKVMLPSYMTEKGRQTSNQYDGFDSNLWVKVPTSNPENAKPEPIQFELRATDWRTIRDTIVENIAINLGINTSTIASFLTDNNARTAREVSTEENETAGYINDKRGLLEKPINRFLKRVTRLLGCTETVVVRWSAAGLTNRQSLTEIINIALSGGFLSPQKAVEMFNYDDDNEQVAEEYKKVVAYNKERQQAMFNINPLGDDMTELPK